MNVEVILDGKMADLICVSHLRWTDGWQRQKQVLSRFARGGRVLFVEEPVSVPDEDEPYLDLYRETDRLTVARLVHPAPYKQILGHGHEHCVTTYVRLLCQYLMQENYDNPILWLYTPMGLEFAEAIPYQLLIYDVSERLEDLSGDYHERESVLMRHANAVFTKTTTNYEACSRRNPHTYFIPDGATWADITRQMQHIIQQRIVQIYSGDPECICQ